MKTRALISAVAILATGLFGSSANAALNPVTDMDPDPNVFECSLTATELDVTIITTNGAALMTNTVHAVAYRDESACCWPAGAGIPIPVINLHTGEMVICHFKNELPTGDELEGASIHWHGIELDNDSDGTGVTQDSVLEGQTYTYRFIAPRPGLFWFHSHMMPGDATFAGMYGAIIIPNASETSLIPSILPTTNFTYTLAMSDIEFGTDTNAADYGDVGKPYDAGSGTNITTINELAHICSTNGSPGNQSAACQGAGKPGEIVLVNGEHPLAKAGIESPTFLVPSNKVIRLRLLNEAISRNFYLTLLDGNGKQINLLRIGGQGGLLNNARLEGGTNGTWDTRYTRGGIVIGSGDRVDVLAFTGTNGPMLRLVGNPLPAPFQLSGSTVNGDPNIPSNYPVAFFKFTNANAGQTATATNAAILTAGPETPVPNISALPTNSLITSVYGGSLASAMRLTTPPSIDGVGGGPLDGNTGNGKFLVVPRPPTARYARIGDLIELSVRNETTAAHPFHLHGFSFQPLRVTDNANPPTNLYTYGYSEFVDTIDVYGGQTLVFRVPLEDRPKFCDGSPLWPETNMGPVLGPCIDAPCGGALGRWLFHCHIFLHAGVGMISELTVLDPLTNYVKAVQQPDLTPTGVDVQANYGTGSQVVADDFQCTSNGPITKISFWGAWLNDIVDSNVTFELRFWSDLPGSPSQPYQELWRELFPSGSYTNFFYVDNPETFYDPNLGITIGNSSEVHQYDFDIPECEAFYQYAGNIYWLSVTAHTSTNTVFFGWKTCYTNEHFNDDATWRFLTNDFVGGWTDLHYPFSHPYGGASMDMAFELTTTVPSNCAPPTASFFGSPTSGPQPLFVNFTDTSNGGITNRFWDFGDGDTANIISTNITHTYTNAGNYSVKLIVNGPCGSGTNTLSNYITVTCPGTLTAQFNGAPTNGVAPLTVGFSDFSIGAIANRFWNFGDGSTTNITGTSIGHTYTNTGTYTVNLTVSDLCGSNTLTKINFITVRTLFQAWLARYFPSGGTNSLPNADPDGDGMSNTNEFLAGFNPTNNAAYLRIISITKIGNDILITYLGANGDITWSPGISSRTNVLEFTKGTANGSYSNNFTSSGLTNILSGGNGNGLVTSFMEPGGATNRPSRYYRIRLLLP